MPAMASPRLGWRGTITVNSCGKYRASSRCTSSQDFLLAGMGRCRHDHRPAARHRHQPLQPGIVGGRRLHIELQIAGGDDVAAAQCGEPFGIDIGLREADFEAAEQRLDGSRNPAPARERAMRHPAVDQNHRQPARRAGQDQVGPQIGLDEQRQRRLPVIEKARDIARRIVGHILMDDVGRKPLGDNLRRGHRARGEQDAKVHRAQPFDQPAAASTSPTLAP